MSVYVCWDILYLGDYFLMTIFHIFVPTIKLSLDNDVYCKQKQVLSVFSFKVGRGLHFLDLIFLFQFKNAFWIYNIIFYVFLSYSTFLLRFMPLNPLNSWINETFHAIKRLPYDQHFLIFLAHAPMGFFRIWTKYIQC